MRRLIALLIAAAACLAVAPAALSYGWPLKPFHKAHPIRGNFGDPRTIFSDPFQPSGVLGGALLVPQWARHLRDPGQAVYPVVSGVARVRDLSAVTVHASGGRASRHAHHSTVYDGQRVTAYKTVIGHIDAVASHVHLERDRRLDRHQPARHASPPPYADHTKPKVASLLLLAPNGKAFRRTGSQDRWSSSRRPTTCLRCPSRIWFGYPVAPAVVELGAPLRQSLRRPAHRRRRLPLHAASPAPVLERLRTRHVPEQAAFRKPAVPDLAGPFRVQADAGSLRHAQARGRDVHAPRDSGGHCRQQATNAEAITVCNADPTSCTAPPAP